jgi:hypothetical protein
MTRPAGRPAALAIVAAGALVLSVLTGCGDGRPSFCDDLARNADLKGLSSALEAKNLPRARSKAKEFQDLADGAPADVRDDLKDLADSVADIVGLLGAERTAGPTVASTVPGATTTTSGSPAGDPAELERLREDLNRRLAELSTTSSRVQDWASRTCGITLS